MKTHTNSLLSLLLLVLSTTGVFSQWSTDPESPGVVCDLVGHQTTVCSFPDDDGGVFVFWLDTRSNPGYYPREIYGQHYDSDGYELWEDNGRLVATHYNGIITFDIKRTLDGSMILGMITQSSTAGAGDTLRFNMLTDTGESDWEEELVVANSAWEPNYILYITNFMLFGVGDEFYVIAGISYFGGSNGNRFTRFDSDGNLLGAYDGVPVGFQGYVGATGCARTYDGSGDFYLYYATGNGSGAALHCFRFNQSGTTVWGPVDVTNGTSGLSYQMAGVSDENGITFAWEGNGSNSTDLFARRLKPDGSFAWGGNIISICTAGGTQTNFHLDRKDSYIYIAWADGRPGTDPGYYDIFAQKMDTTGYLYWAPDGLQVASFNTYSPYPKVEVLDDYSIVVNHQSTLAGFMAQMVDPSGALLWGPEAVEISAIEYNPFYHMHTVFQSGQSTIAVWNKAASGGGADGVYISRVDLLTRITEPLTSHWFTVFPNPASDRINVILPGNTNSGELILYNATGKIVISKPIVAAQEKTTVTLSTKNLPAGSYILRLSTEDGSESSSATVVVR